VIAPCSLVAVSEVLVAFSGLLTKAARTSETSVNFYQTEVITQKVATHTVIMTDEDFQVMKHLLYNSLLSVLALS
jgi:hypothetical protein